MLLWIGLGVVAAIVIYWLIVVAVRRFNPETEVRREAASQRAAAQDAVRKKLQKDPPR
jgi:hypothetical protein